MLKNLIYKLSTSKYLQYFFTFAMVLMLCSCNKMGDGSGSEEGNYNAQASCWQTRVISAVLMIVNSLYKKSTDYVTQNAMTTGGTAVICIAFSIWMAFKILKSISSFKEENLGEVWTEIGQKLFVCMFCAWIVYNTDNISWSIKTFVMPIYNTILELGVRLLKESATASAQDLGFFGRILYTNNYSTCEVRDLTEGSLDLKEAISPMANCLVCAISDRLNSGFKIGIALICTWKIAAIIIGLFVLFLFLAAKFFFVFFIIDGLFRINFAVFFFPIMIIGVPFSYTRKWSKHCFLMFLNSSGIMMFIGLLVAISVSVLERIVGNIGNLFSISNTEGAGPVLLSVLFIAFLLVNVPAQGVALADKFIEGGGTDAFQKKVSKFAMTVAKKTAATILSTLSKSMTRKITDALEKYENTKEIADTIKQVANKANSLAGYNDD